MSPYKPEPGGLLINVTAVITNFPTVKSFSWMAKKVLWETGPCWGGGGWQIPAGPAAALLTATWILEAGWSQVPECHRDLYLTIQKVMQGLSVVPEAQITGHPALHDGSCHCSPINICTWGRIQHGSKLSLKDRGRGIRNCTPELLGLCRPFLRLHSSLRMP